MNSLKLKDALTALPEILTSNTPWTEATTKYEIAQFEKLTDSDPRLINEVTVDLDPKKALSYASVRHFNCNYLDENGNSITTTQRSFELKPNPDAVDVIAYRLNKNGAPELAILKLLRPTIAAREFLIPCETPVSPFIRSLPSSYIIQEHEVGIDETTRRICLTQLGLEPIEDPDHAILPLLYPSIGTGGEVVATQLVKVACDDDEPMIHYGANTYFNSIRTFESPQSIIDSYFQGETPNLRIVLAAFQLAEQFGIRLNIPDNFNLELPVIDRKESLLPIIEVQDIKKIISDPTVYQGQNTLVSSISLTEIVGSNSSFLKGAVINVTTKSEDGRILESYPIDLVHRKGFDSVDALSLCIIRNEDGIDRLHMVVNEGIRESLMTRELANHVLGFQTGGFRNIEGVAGTCEGDLSPSGIISLARKEIEEESGVQVLGEPTYIGSAYTSPGTGFEKAFLCAAAIDPSKPSPMRPSFGESLRTVLATPDSIILASNEGIVRDPRLLLEAYIAQAAFRDRVSPTIQEKKNFHTIVTKAPENIRWITDASGGIHAVLMSSSPSYRRVVCSLEAEVGLRVIRTDHPIEQRLFEGILPIFIAPSMNDPRKMPYNLIHDLFHWTLGSIVPIKRDQNKNILRDSYGNPLFIPVEEMRLGDAGNEVEAVFFSDVTVPREHGYEKAEDIFKGISLGRAFEEDLGVPYEEIKNIIYSIERDGFIPSELIQHPKYDNVRNVLVGRLLRYHALDTHHITNGLYKHWTSQPFLSETALRFFPLAFTDYKEHEQWFVQSEEYKRGYPSGINPLKRLLAQHLSFNIGLGALRLAYFYEQIGKNRSPGYEKVQSQILDKLIRLEEAKKELTEAHLRTKDFGFSEYNLDSLRRLERIKRQVLEPIWEWTLKLSLDQNYLTDLQINHSYGRLMPFLNNLPFDMTPNLIEVVYNCEKSSFEKARRPFSYATPNLDYYMAEARRVR